MYIALTFVALTGREAMNFSLSSFSVLVVLVTTSTYFSVVATFGWFHFSKDSSVVLAGFCAWL